MIWFFCERFKELPELLRSTAAGPLLPVVAEGCVFVLAGDKHGALLRAAVSSAHGGMGNQALFLLVNHREDCNYFSATQSDPAFN